MAILVHIHIVRQYTTILTNVIIHYSTGRMHIAQGVLRAINVNKLTSTGCLFKFWVADWFAQLNNKMDGDLKKIRLIGQYMIEIWKAIGKPCCLGVVVCGGIVCSGSTILYYLSRYILYAYTIHTTTTSTTEPNTIP